MGVKVATPATIAGDAAELVAGDVLELAAGTYRDTVVFKGLAGAAGRPIRIRARPGAVFDAGLPLPDSVPKNPDGTRRPFTPADTGYAVVERARQFVGQMDPATEFPGIYRHSDEGQVRFLGCHDVIVEGLVFRNCWPTAVALMDSRALDFRSIRIEGAAYAFQARGAGTARLRLQDCSWTQDTTERLLWGELFWSDVHGNWGEADGNGWRCFDGSFFNANDIAGAVEIAGCTVRHAFNGIHLFNRERRPDLSVGVRVHGCTFSHIKDNPIEAEDAAWNWWIHDNVFHNCHKWLSLELKKVGWFYIFRNRGWADDRPGPPDDANASGAVFKFFKQPDKPKIARSPIYVFNNSWALRSTVVQEGFARSLWHVNNAIRFYGPADGKRPPVYWPWTPFFGRRDVADPDTRLPPADFTRRWSSVKPDFDIQFDGDVTNHPDFPAGLQAAGYAVRPGAAADPRFVSPTDGDLTFRADSPCIGAARALTVNIMKDGEQGPDIALPAGINVGWDQGPADPFAELRAHAPRVDPLDSDSTVA